LHAVLQQTPSAQWPFVQSASTTHLFPFGQRVGQCGPPGLAGPPQSTSVSFPSLTPSLHVIIPPQPFVVVEQVSSRPLQVSAVQVQLLATHLPWPEGGGNGHCVSVLHWTHLPAPSQTPPEQFVLIGAGGYGTPAVQPSTVHALPSLPGMSLLSGSLAWPPLPSQT
jgi:hypothetical protein